MKFIKVKEYLQTGNYLQDIIINLDEINAITYYKDDLYSLCFSKFFCYISKADVERIFEIIGVSL